MLLVAVLDQHRAQHVHAKRHDAWATGQCALGIKNELLHRPPARTTVLLRPVVGVPATLVQDGVPLGLVFFAQSLAGLDLAGDIFGQLFLQKSLHFGAERLFLGGELQIHCLCPQ
ncbi:hypothetical protein D3C72_1966200 [compost metagenome]